MRSTLVLDEVARRESIEATDEDLEQPRSAASPSARDERRPRCARGSKRKARSIGSASGVRREKTMAWLLERANVVTG